MSELADKFEFRVRWEPFLLRPNTPPEGTPKPAAFADPNNPRVQYLKQAGRDVGIEFSHKATLTPNTLKAHALLEIAKVKGDAPLQNQVAEKLFEAYFTNGKLLDEETLLDVAKQTGLSQADVKSYINSNNVTDQIRTRALHWGVKGVTGVPFFYMNGHRMFSGAQGVDTFKKMIEMASEKFPLSSRT